MAVTGHTTPQPRPRIDVQKLYAALDGARRERDMSWRRLAAEVGCSPSTMTRLAQNHRPDVDAFAALVQWLKAPAEEFMIGAVRPDHTEPPHQGVYRPASFICGDQTVGCVVTFTARPGEQVAAGLLEDVGDWYRALRGLPAGADVPPPVVDAVGTLLTAVQHWVELNERRSASARRAARAALDPGFDPGPGAA